MRANRFVPVTDKTLNYLHLAHQVEQETPTFGGGEQGANKERDDPVLGHCGFLACQHLGVVATLESSHVAAVTMKEERTGPYSTCQMLATRCTQSLCVQDLDMCSRPVAHKADIMIFVYLIHVQFYFFTLISPCLIFSHIFVFITNLLAQC